MSWVFWLGGDIPAGVEIGGKARGLLRLVAAGLPCPRGMIVPAATVAAIRAGQPQALAALDRECAGLRLPVIVRSSASIEDSELGAAPGIFKSVPNVKSTDAIVTALECVSRSADSDAVRSYCNIREIDEGAIEIAAIVQEQVEAESAGTLYTRAPGRPRDDDMVCDIRRSSSGPSALTLGRHDGDLTPEPSARWRSLRAAALKAERAIGAEVGADIEWVIDRDDGLWIVQARPIIHPPATSRPPPQLFSVSKGDSRVWRWDVTHNPDPLSPAQASLVRMVARRGIGGEMRVVGGYLYYASADPSSASPPTTGGDHDVASIFTHECLPAALAVLAPYEHLQSPPLRGALEAYAKLAVLYAEVIRPTLQSGRERLRAFLLPTLGAATDDTLTALLNTRSDRHLVARIRRVARGEESLDPLLDYAAPMSPAWDVAAPTFAEDPSPVLHAVELHRQRREHEDEDEHETQERRAHALHLRQSFSPAAASEFDIHLAAAIQAQELGEVNNHIFFRAQAMIRRALLGIAARWNAEADDIFYAELEWLVEHANRERPPSDFIRRVEAARARRDAQRDVLMPLEIVGGLAAGDRPLLRGGHAWRGTGAGGRARGRVVKVADLGQVADVGDGRVVVARSLSPSLIFAVSGAAAVVSVYGGPLGHGAAMARELGIPCIVRCTGAWRNLRDGDDVWVDGESGWLVRTGG